jgi:hypothetical protein
MPAQRFGERQVFTGTRYGNGRDVAINEVERLEKNRRVTASEIRWAIPVRGKDPSLPSLEPQLPR